MHTYFRSDEEDNEFEIVEDASTSSVLDEKKQKMQKILEILKQKAEDTSSDEFSSSDEEQQKESSKTTNSCDSESDDCVITSVVDWPVDHAKYEKKIKAAEEIECIVLDSDDDTEKPSTSGIQFKSSSKISLPPPKSS